MALFFSPQAAHTSKHKQNKSLHTPMTYSNRAGVRWMTFAVLLWQSGRENEEMWCMNMSEAFCECVGVLAFVSARAASVSTAVTDSSAGRTPPLRELPSVLWLSLVMRREREREKKTNFRPSASPSGGQQVPMQPFTHCWSSSLGWHSPLILPWYQCHLGGWGRLLL